MMYPSCNCLAFLFRYPMPIYAPYDILLIQFVLEEVEQSFTITTCFLLINIHSLTLGYFIKCGHFNSLGGDTYSSNVNINSLHANYM